MNFNENLKSLMYKNKYSIRGLAKKTGISKTALYYYLKGERVPNIYTAIDIAEALGVTLNELCYGKG